MLIQLDARDMEAKHAQRTVHTTAIKYPEPNRRDPTSLQFFSFNRIPATEVIHVAEKPATGNSEIAK